MLEAQASGLPVVAVNEGGPASLIVDGETGLLCPPDADALATAVVSVATQPLLASRLRRAALGAVAGRSWEAALQWLADGYHRVLGPRDAGETRDVA
jgi:glycosyltransferase involved in cell wall biosynthesis